MKRLLSFLFAVLILLGFCAMTEHGNGSIGDMLVLNCEEWVSLREKPNTRAERIKKVPLNSLVMDCFWYSDEFIYCNYNGEVGYILSEYLLEIKDEFAQVVQYGDEFSILCFRSYKESSESMNLICRNHDASIRWHKVLKAPYATELSCTDAFIAGTFEEPVVIAHVSGVGLMALSAENGELMWILDAEEASLGGSISSAVDAEGNMYIGGFYGPDPVAINKEGKILWFSNTGMDYTWLSHIEITDEGICAYYDYTGDVDSTGSVLFDLSGNVISLS